MKINEYWKDILEYTEEQIWDFISEFDRRYDWNLCWFYSMFPAIRKDFAKIMMYAEEYRFLRPKGESERFWFDINTDESLSDETYDTIVNLAKEINAKEWLKHQTKSSYPKTGVQQLDEFMEHIMNGGIKENGN